MSVGGKAFWWVEWRVAPREASLVDPMVVVMDDWKVRKTVASRADNSAWHWVVVREHERVWPSAVWSVDG